MKSAAGRAGATQGIPAAAQPIRWGDRAQRCWATRRAMRVRQPQSQPRTSLSAPVTLGSERSTARPPTATANSE
eukprot:88620-Pleurochrysis_carterae.AAC.2